MSGAKNPKKGPTRILVVEDDRDVANMVKRMLDAEGTVDVVHDGKAALDTILKAAEPYTLVVTDVAMPRMDGYQLAKEMKKHDQSASVPVIMLTAKTDARDVISGINAGARFYLTKPFQQEDLVAKVRKVLGKK